jgi:hypothetical protein
VTESQTAVPQTFRRNLITDFYDLIREAGRAFDAESEAVRDGEIPAFQFPELTPEMADFFGAAGVCWQQISMYQGLPVALLNLAANPATQTTKTFASLLIVARAVEHIRRRDEPVVIFSPTSANKGTALRDAVQRAIDCGLVNPAQLRVAILVPRASVGKLRRSRLSDDPDLAALNPVLVLDSPVPENVKTLGREFANKYAAEVRRCTGALLWYTLDLSNYLIADMARAYFEHAVAPVDATTRPRTHVHAVSSAFGLLGYHRGRQFLEDRGLSDPAQRPGSLLVQHLGTPDMVVHTRFGGFHASRIPEYHRDATTGRYYQDSDPHFPQVTDDPAEVLDRTFYTRRPTTAPAMSGIIAEHGGDGIVVSRHDCTTRYPELREWLELAGFAAPMDWTEVREWSLVMAFTGALNAVDRGLIGPDDELVVHGSGWYLASQYRPLGDAARPVSAASDIARAITG